MNRGARHLDGTFATRLWPRLFRDLRQFLFIATAIVSSAAPAAGQQQQSDEAIRFIERNLAADRTGDGRLDESEAGLAFASMDADRDGYVSEDELRSFARRYFRPFTWVNPIRDDLELPPGVHHGTFLSSSMGHEIGYVVFLPPGYEATENAQRRYPVVYYLHGGRPGNETRSIALTQFVYDAMSSEKVPPAIYVYANGGQVSHYNVPAIGSMGEFALLELILHIDATHRTIAAREGRALEGFSQGGRGATRIALKHPHLFVSAALGGPGYAVERSIYENGGVEEDPRVQGAQRWDFGEGNDAYSLALSYAENNVPSLRLAVWIGTAGFNYEATLEYLGFLYALGIEPQRFVVPDVTHNPLHLYEEIGNQLMQFHADSFAPSAR